MTTVVLGGGVIGVTTAYYLARAGHEVTVLERNDGVGEETSYQNGALLAPGHSHSWATPGALAMLLKSFFQKDSPFGFRPSLDPQLWRWGLKFLGNCTDERYRANTLRTFRCMQEGLAELRALSAETGISYDGNDKGILYLFRTEETFAERSGDWNLLLEHGLELEQCDRDRCVEIEPTLGPVKDRIGGGFFSPNETAGDAFLFSQRLAEHCAELGVRFEYSTTISGIETRAGKVTAVRTDKGEFTGERYVVALGPEAPYLCRPAGVNLPMWPAKGYTATIPVEEHHEPPTVGVIEEDNMISMANLGGRMRLGGKAEFVGFDKSYSDKDLESVFKVARDLFPNMGDFSRPQLWACLRPVSAGGPPILGETPVDNLFLNVGHGAQGWTEACATSRAVADIVSGREPELDMEGLRLADL
ncbi:MAG TPA: D-amino acid dehydrogenase [Arenicellales bacterium]|nr:D-amino acid dehydrogenase [Arenicellales bacterium]